ncbi:hypothetical protein AB4Y32_37675 [Paraburkholderia phymatum]|uniref:Uncharacterized protein n=1 Tax=Paraburkholderia phymatum TaxID=148447 RepID=A0ACC6UCV7_9BURK
MIDLVRRAANAYRNLLECLLRVGGSIAASPHQAIDFFRILKPPLVRSEDYCPKAIRQNRVLISH